MREYICKNDNALIIFHVNNIIIWKIHDRKGKLKLQLKAYMMLIKIYESGDVFCVDSHFLLCMMSKLIELGIVLKVKEMNLYKNSIHEKNFIFFSQMIGKNNAITNICKKTVLVIGAGAIGIEIINHLVSVGINKMIIVDGDTIKITNLNRQYAYTKSDIGRYKIEVLRTRMLSRIPVLDIKTFNQYIENYSSLARIIDRNNVDLIVCAADTPIYLIRKIVTEIGICFDIPIFFCGVGLHNGTIGPLFNKKKFKINYISKLETVIKRCGVSYPISSSLGATNSIIAGYAAKDIIFFLAEEYEHVKSLNRSYKVSFGSEINE